MKGDPPIQRSLPALKDQFECDNVARQQYGFDSFIPSSFGFQADL